MAGDIPSFDDWKKSKGGEEIEVSPELQETINEIKPRTTWEKFTSPTEPEDFSLSRVATSTGIGLGIGAIGGFPGMIGGGATGLVSGIAGEVARTQGASPATTLTAELLGGVSPTTFVKFGTKALGVFSYKGQKLGNLLKLTGEEDRAILRAKEALYGSDTFKGMALTKNSDEVQAVVKSELSQMGINIPENMKASDFLRKELFNDLDKLASQSTAVTTTTKPVVDRLGVVISPSKTVTINRPNIFAFSDEAKAMNLDLAALQQRGFVTEAETSLLNRLLKNQSSPDPKVAGKAKDDLLNLIQNRGVYSTAEGETKTKISAEAQKVLREQFNNYLEKNTGRKGYDVLKQIEMKEFTAEALDSIPTLIDTSFKYGTKEIESALMNIANSPTGKQEFAKALTNHFKRMGNSIKDVDNFKQVGREINPDTMKAEFTRLRPMILKAKLMTEKEMANLTYKINQLPSVISFAKKAGVIEDLVKSALIGVGSAETASNLNIQSL